MKKISTLILLLVYLSIISACTPALPKTKTTLEVQKLASSVKLLQQEIAQQNEMNSKLIQSNEQLQQSFSDNQKKLLEVEQACKAAAKRPATIIKRLPQATKPVPAVKAPEPQLEQKPKYPEFSPSDAPAGS